ncbi:MAG TPA: L-serine ammonia-lyase, iron-sulfur-dependent, subunit alpha [Candidatus Aminicenantes bacterium]|nr:L-serine ammonia-lyase, iron-sulfur-dependent, subunit alpha [Candidatus Aminicenantes bacterium]
MQDRYEKFIATIKREVLPALGCTEPIAVALASAQAARALGEPPERLKVTVSPNILKNALGVGIPGTGMTGLLIASALGALGGDSSRGLEVLQGLSPERIQAAKEFVREERVEVEKCEGEGKLFIDVTAYGKGHRGRSVIRNTHTSVVLVERDGEVLESREAVEGREGEEEECAAVPMTVEEIFRFATEVPLEKIAFLEEGARLNNHIAQEGLKGSYGLKVGKTLWENRGLSLMGEGLSLRAIARTSAAADARMAGCSLPVMSNSGSGNQGLTVALPILSVVEDLGLSREKLLRALALGHLTAIHLKSYVGRLSALCGAFLAAIGAGAGITWLLGGGYPHVAATIKNMVGGLAGMICDGAKPGCALKISTALSAAFQASLLSLRNIEISERDGIIENDLEKTIRNVGTIASEGMNETDRLILEIMVCK